MFFYGQSDHCEIVFLVLDGSVDRQGGSAQRSDMRIAESRQYLTAFGGKLLVSGSF